MSAAAWIPQVIIERTEINMLHRETKIDALSSKIVGHAKA